VYKGILLILHKSLHRRNQRHEQQQQEEERTAFAIANKLSLVPSSVSLRGHGRNKFKPSRFNVTPKPVPQKIHMYKKTSQTIQKHINNFSESLTSVFKSFSKE